MWILQTERKRGSKDANSETVDVIYGSSLTGKAMGSVTFWMDEEERKRQMETDGREEGLGRTYNKLSREDGLQIEEVRPNTH